MIIGQEQIILEQEILGLILSNSNLIIKCKECIKPVMFLVREHNRIYSGILEMADKKMDIDTVSFITYHSEDIKSMNSREYIYNIASCCPSEVGFETKIELLIRNYKKYLYLEFCKKTDGTCKLEEIEKSIDDTIIKVNSANFINSIDIEGQYNEYIANLYDKNKEQGISSGFRNLDKYLGNFRKGRLITIFSRSGIGKTTFSLQLAANMALRGAKVIYGSSEMSNEEIFNKMSSSNKRINYSSISEGKLSDEQKGDISEFMARLLTTGFYITNEVDIDKFIYEVKVYKLKHNLDVVFVDYINKYVDNNSTENLSIRLGKISSKLKDLAMKENICVVMLAQANRNVDKNGSDIVQEKISQGDIMDSARIEQDSDQVLALYRNKKLDDKMYRDRLYKSNEIKYTSKNAEVNPNCINVLILKNRHGESGTCALRWEGQYSRVGEFQN